MNPTEKLKTLLEILASKAILGKSTRFNLLLRDVQEKGLDIGDTITVLSRLQSDKIVDTLSIFQAENTRPGNAASHLIENILGPHFDLDHVDRNSLTVSHILKMVLFPPFLRVLEEAGIEKTSIDLLTPLFSVTAHPEKIDIYCPLHRCAAGNVVDEKGWVELAKGMTLKCKDRRHDILAAWRNGQITVSLPCEKTDEDTRQA